MTKWKKRAKEKKAKQKQKEEKIQSNIVKVEQSEGSVVPKKPQNDKGVIGKKMKNSQEDIQYIKDKAIPSQNSRHIPDLQVNGEGLKVEPTDHHLMPGKLHALENGNQSQPNGSSIRLNMGVSPPKRTKPIRITKRELIPSAALQHRFLEKHESPYSFKKPL